MQFRGAFVLLNFHPGVQRGGLAMYTLPLKGLASRIEACSAARILFTCAQMQGKMMRVME